MRTPARLVRCRHENDIGLNPTISLTTGEPLVDFYSGLKAEMEFRPIEAERLGRALIAVAALARKRHRILTEVAKRRRKGK